MKMLSKFPYKTTILILIALFILFLILNFFEIGLGNTTTMKQVSFKKFKLRPDQIKNATDLATSNIDAKGQTEQQKHELEETGNFSKDELDIIRTRQSVTKVHLAGVYSALVSMKSDYGFYTTDLKSIGYELKTGLSNYKDRHNPQLAENKVTLKVGFIEAPRDPGKSTKPDRMNSDVLIDTDPEYKHDYLEELQDVELSKFAKF